MTADIKNRGIPGPQDSALVLQEAVTKTASANSAGLDLGEGFNPGGIGVPMAAVVTVTAADLASGETYSFVVQESDDNSTFIAASVAAAATEVGVLAVGALIKRRYVRLALTAGGTSPSITYSAYLNPNV